MGEHKWEDSTNKNAEDSCYSYHNFLSCGLIINIPSKFFEFVEKLN